MTSTSKTLSVNYKTAMENKWFIIKGNLLSIYQFYVSNKLVFQKIFCGEIS